MFEKKSDTSLGMYRPITRRDLVHGAAALTALGAVGCQEKSSVKTVQLINKNSINYPPAQKGLRGSHEGSFETAHKLGREGWREWGEPAKLNNEVYDLIIVGAGISGLSAAFFYRQENPDAKILILDNHDDFGGHAKRNEVEINGRMLLCHGGAQSFDDPGSFSGVVKKLMRDIGLNIKDMRAAFDDDFYTRYNLTSGIFFDAARFGQNKLVNCQTTFTKQFYDMVDGPKIADVAQGFPVDPVAREQIVKLFETDPSFKRFTENEIEQLLYLDYLKAKVPNLHADVIDFLDASLLPLLCFGIDVIPAAYAIACGLPGEKPAKQNVLLEPYRFHLPDGNASIARMIVSRLNSKVIQTTSIDDVSSAHTNYAALDTANSDVRIRLLSTVVEVKHVNEDPTKDVLVCYVKGGSAYQVSARHCILACYNMMIPHIVPSLPEAQRAALSQNVKAPLVYASVFVNNWRAWVSAGVANIYFPQARFSMAALDFPVSLKDYKYAGSPDDATAIHMVWAPRKAGLSPADQNRAGRMALMDASFEDLERGIRQQLQDALGAHGFDAARDIAAIVINRHAHGYAPDGDLYGEISAGKVPFTERGREKFGNISIANSDAGGIALIDCAIDQAWRAIKEVSA